MAPHRAVHRKASPPMQKTDFLSHDSMYCEEARQCLPSRPLVATHGYRTRTVAPGERRAPCPRGGGLHIDKPEIWWPAVALTRFRRDASIRRDQREFALDRMLGGKDDSQRCALPRRNRRRHDCNVSILAGTFGLSWCSSRG